MTEKQRAAAIVAALEEEYPGAQCSLIYTDPWRLLVAVRLAAQCTDARVNVVTPALFARYGTPQAMAAAQVADVAAIVAPCGLGNTKARDLVAMSAALLQKYGGVVPATMDGLLALPGVGRKSANLILGDIYGLPAVVCDTHCIRITNLMGLSTTKDPAKVEKELRAILAPEKSNDFCHRMVLHGRAVCKARSPQCGRCCCAQWCDHARAR